MSATPQQPARFCARPGCPELIPEGKRADANRVLIAEVELCEVLCRSCHKAHHREEKVARLAEANRR